MNANILWMESLIALVTSGEENQGEDKRWEGDFSIHSLLQLLNFELCEYIIYSNSIFKLFLKMQLALCTVTLINRQIVYLSVEVILRINSVSHISVIINVSTLGLFSLQFFGIFVQSFFRENQVYFAVCFYMQQLTLERMSYENQKYLNSSLGFNSYQFQTWNPISFLRLDGKKEYIWHSPTQKILVLSPHNKHFLKIQKENRRKERRKEGTSFQ